MKNKGTITLLIVLVVLAVAVVFASISPGTLFAPAAANQIYEPSVPSATEKVVCIAFDDGWKTHLEVLPILEHFGFHATFPIVTSYVGYPAYMNWDNIASLAQKGNDIVSHTQTHSNLSAVNEAMLRSELEGSRQTLRSHGYAADILVYPYGEASSNLTVRDAAAQTYLLAAGLDNGQNDRYDVKTVVVYPDMTLQSFADSLQGTQGNNVTVLYYHKVSDEQGTVSLAAFQTQMQYLKDNGYITKTMSELFLKTAK